MPLEDRLRPLNSHYPYFDPSPTGVEALREGRRSAYGRLGAARTAHALTPTGLSTLDRRANGPYVRQTPK
jgi:hypothetical protein